VPVGRPGMSVTSMAAVGADNKIDISPPIIVQLNNENNTTPIDTLARLHGELSVVYTYRPRSAVA
jgi:hypothetical protein